MVDHDEAVAFCARAALKVAKRANEKNIEQTVAEFIHLPKLFVHMAMSEIRQRDPALCNKLVARYVNSLQT